MSFWLRHLVHFHTLMRQAHYRIHPGRVHPSLSPSSDLLVVLDLCGRIFGFFMTIVLVPPAFTWSRVRHHGSGQPPTRSRAHTAGVLAQYLIRIRGRETVRVTNVKGHATDADVEQGRVRLVDQIENAEADTAADLGRRHRSEMIMDARSCLLKVRTHWYPIMQQLHRFMIAISRVAVNHDEKGGFCL